MKILSIILLIFIFSSCGNPRKKAQRTTGSTKEIPISSGSCKCTNEYKPVCSNDKITFGNACFARCQGKTSYTNGGCPIGPSPKNCVCNQVYNPVCGSDKKTYTNACLAKCGDVSFKSGPCSGLPYPKKYCSSFFSPLMVRLTGIFVKLSVLEFFINTGDA